MIISAIVSAYNTGGLLEGCIENLREQTVPVEIVMVVQHGSIEHPLIELADTYVITMDIPGLYEAWNAGIERARGKYITNANADDRKEPTACEELAAELDKGYDLAYSDFKITDGMTVTERKRKPYSLEELRRKCVVGPAPMWKKSIHTEYGYFDEDFIVAGDYEFWLRIAKEDNFSHIPKPLVTYYDNPFGIENRNKELAAKERERIHGNG